MPSYYIVAGLSYSPELYHHGIKGQKWGVRKYQNPDGTLTTAGRERYGTGRAREELGFGEKGHLNSVQRHLTSNYKAYKNAAERQYYKGAKAKLQGKNYKKYENAGREFEKAAKQYATMAKNYNDLPHWEQKSINRGSAFTKAFGTIMAGGVGRAVAEISVDSQLKKRLR